MIEYLSTLTVKALREIAKQAGITHYSRMRKAELVTAIRIDIDFDHIEALNMDAVIEEAYADKAEDAGMTLPAYMAHKSAHRKAGDIKASGFWNCCVDNPTHVVVWEDGAKQAVCKGTASYYTGTVEELPTGHKEKCADCGESFWVAEPVIDSEEKDDTTIDAFLAEIHAALKPLAERANRYFAEANDNEVAEVEEWWQISKDLSMALHNTEWLVNFRNPIHIEA